MAAPTYVAKKVGDQYVVVPKNPPATVEGGAWLAGGLLLAGFGLLRRGACGALMTAAGGAMIYRGVTGCHVHSSFLKLRLGGESGGEEHQSPSFQHDDRTAANQTPQDDIDEASMESFPASDPPAKRASTAV